MSFRQLGNSDPIIWALQSSPPIDTSPNRKSSNGTTCVDCGNSVRGEVLQADIVHGVFLCVICAKLHHLLLPGPHRILRIPQSRRESKEKGWTINDIERLTRLGNLRVQQYYMGSSQYYMKQFWLHEHGETFWKHDEKPSQHVPKKYIQRSFAKKGHTLADIPKLAARHGIESRVLQSLGLAAAATIPTSEIYQLHLENPALKAKDDIPVHPALLSSYVPMVSKSSSTPDRSHAVKRGPSIVIIPRPTTPMSQSDDEDTAQTITAQSSSTSNVTRVSVKFPPVLPTVRKVETPLEWSLRMKRYQEEEIEYLGLTTIKPVLSTPIPTSTHTTTTTRNPTLVLCKPHPAVREVTLASQPWESPIPAPTSTHTPTLVLRKLAPAVREVTPMSEPQESIELVRSEDSSPKKTYTRLSKRRFEEWLEKISPYQSPPPASRPSTVADDDKELSDRVSIGEEQSDVCTAVKMESDEETESITVRMVGSGGGDKMVDVGRKVCGECGREMGKTSREWGVQTDISSRLIVF